MIIYLFLFLFQTLNASENNSNSIQIGVSDVPPISYIKNGKLTGMNIDIIKQLERESNLNFNLTLYPHARVKKSLESAQPDLLIVFKVVCEKYSDEYEMQDTPLYSLPPVIHLKKSMKNKVQSARVARVNGTCMKLSDHNIKDENIVDVSGLDQAFKMLKADRIDGICGNDPVFQYSLKQYREFKSELFAYKVAGNPEDYSAVICRKKSLSQAVKNKLEKAANKIIVPSYWKFL